MTAEASRTGRSGLVGRLVHYWRTRSIGFGLENIGYLTLKRPRLVALFIVVLSVVLFSQIPRTNVDGDLMRVFANSGEDYDAYARLQKSFGTFENDIYMLVSSPTGKLTDPAVVEQVRNLAFDLELNDYASQTLSPFTLRKTTPDGDTVPAVPENMQSQAEVTAALSDLQQNNPMMRNLISADLSRFVLIMAQNPEPEVAYVDSDNNPDTPSILLPRTQVEKNMIASLRGLAAQYESPDLHVELTGPPVWTSELIGAAVGDQLKFTFWGFGLGAIIALVSLRSFWGALIVSATPFVAVMWVMGTTLLLFGSFSFLTILVTTLVLVIAFAESLFFVFNWLAYWRDGMNPYKAVNATVKVVGPASALTMLTTVVSFASLSFTAGQGIREFSIVGSIASFMLYICLMTFLPLLLKGAVRLGFKLPKPSTFVLTAPMKASWFLATRFGRVIAVGAIVVTGLLLIPYFNIQPNFSFQDVLTKDSSALQAAADIDQGVGGVAPIYVRIPMQDADPTVSDRDYATIKQVHQIVEKYAGASKGLSLASFQNYMDQGSSRAQILDIAGDLRNRLITPDGKEALITGFFPTIMSSEQLETTVSGMRSDLAAAGLPQAEIGGFRIMTTFATENIVRGLQLDLTMSVIVNLFLIGFAFRSLRVATATAIPNLFPVLGTEAYLWFSGAGLQLTTVISLTIAFGIAVDDTTHFLSHYLHARREEGYNHRDAVHHTMQRIGGAIVATTLILCAGTGIVSTSDLPQVALFGTLFVITLGLALIGDVFILPALLVAGGDSFILLEALKHEFHGILGAQHGCGRRYRGDRWRRRACAGCSRRRGSAAELYRFVEWTWCIQRQEA